MLQRQKGQKQQGSMNPFEQGMAAAQAGRPVQACPFGRSSREWVRWFSGWQNYYCEVNRKRVRGEVQQ